MNLDENLAFEFLIKLPVRSLLRFRCVCKEWCALIKSPLFKGTYLALRRARAVDEEVVGLKVIRNYSGFYKSYLSCCYGDYEPLVLSASVPSPSPNDFEIPGNRSGSMIIINHVDGIVCVKGEYHGPWTHYDGEHWFDMILVNPALREVRKLPVPDLEESELFLLSAGLGYDDSSNDYKVVIIVSFKCGYKQIGLVYYLSTNSWTILGDMSDFVSYSHFLTMSEESIFTHGSIHWTMRSEPDFRIVTFNMTNDLFQEEMLFPHAWRYYEATVFPHIFTIDKSTIAVAAVPEYMDFSVAQVLDIWVMNEYGNSESWTKQYSISSLPSFRRPLSFWKKDKLLVLTLDCRLVTYDLFSGHVYEYGQRDPIFGSYGLLEGQVYEPEQYDPIFVPLEWELHLVTGHESFVSIKQV